MSDSQVAGLHGRLPGSKVACGESQYRSNRRG